MAIESSPPSGQRRLLLRAGASLLALGHAGWGRAQAWPERPIRIIVPYPAGGGADIVARSLSEHMQRQLGQPVIIENKVGATGTIGATAVVRSAPDGYTLFLNQAGPGVTARFTQKDIRYDPLKDLSSVVLVGRSPIAVMVASDSPFRTLNDLVEAARTQPGKLDYGTPGLATPSHIAAEMMQMLTGTRLTHIPYKGSAGNANAALARQVAVVFDTVPPFLPLLRGGRMRALALAGNARLPALADVPTAAERGVSGLESYTWYALSGPANLPRPIVDRINAVANSYIRSAEGHKRLDELGLLPERGGSPEAFAAFLKDQSAKLEPVIRTAGITSD